MVVRISLLEAHRQALERWRRSMNLVGPGDLDEHYLDCERALGPVEDPRGRWVDLGSGAGFPGIVFAAQHVGEGCWIELVDVRRKRCVFLEHVLGVAGVGPSQVAVRCTDVEGLDPASYDGVLARGFASPAEVLERARRLLRPGGRIVLFLQESGVVPEAPDFRVEFDHPYEVGGRQRRSVGLRRLPVGSDPA
jgi:16S rRNA (guanine527-N7)-methyltransferase